MPTSRSDSGSQDEREVAIDDAAPYMLSPARHNLRRRSDGRVRVYARGAESA